MKKPAFVILRIEPTGKGGDFTPPVGEVEMVEFVGASPDEETEE